MWCQYGVRAWFYGRMKTNKMKALIHFKGILCLMNPNYDYDNFWLHRFLHPEVVLYQMEAVSHKVRRKNVDRSAKRGLVVGKELGDH